MKKSLSAAFIAVIIILFFVSCASKPPPAPQEPPSPQRPASSQQPAASSDQVSLDELNAAKEKAEKSRKTATDFESPSYFPGEWEAAEALFTQAGQISLNSDDNAKKAAGTYDAAADSYDAVFNLAIPLYAQAKEDEIMETRGELIAAGARDQFPDYFTPADQEALKAYDQYEEKEYFSARETAVEALGIYQALTAAYNTWLVRQSITEKGFENYDPESFDDADELLIDAMNDYTEKDIPKMREKVRDAAGKYNNVLAAGWPPYARLRFSLAETERQTALDNKADVATRDIFAEADSMYKKSTELLESENYEEAAKEFIRAETHYVMANTETLRKRRHAAEAIAEAEVRIEELRRLLGIEAE